MKTKPKNQQNQDDITESEISKNSRENNIIEDEPKCVLATSQKQPRPTLWYHDRRENEQWCKKLIATGECSDHSKCSRSHPILCKNYENKQHCRFEAACRYLHRRFISANEKTVVDKNHHEDKKKM